MKTFCLFLTFLITEHLVLNTAIARDCGTHGVIYPIQEEDPIGLIQKKLRMMEERGELAQHYHELQKKAKAFIESPKPVEGITRAQKSRVFYYDPTYIVPEDLKDHTGMVLFRKGTKINPLERVNLSQNLLFLDGEDDEQREWVKEKLQKGPIKLILTKGFPLELSGELGIPVYFDQGGVLTKKLGIKCVPAIVTQDLSQQRQEASSDNKSIRSPCLRIEEIALEEKR